MKIITDVLHRSADMLVNRPYAKKVKAYQPNPRKRLKTLAGKNTLIGENNVAIFIMIKRNLGPSTRGRILLVPIRRLALMGTYFTVLPDRRKARVDVVG
jgi:hypothetical protein